MTEQQNPTVVFKIENHADIVIELDATRAPLTVANFLQYVDDEFYDGTVFHRVIENFMIQGGGFDRRMKEKSTREPVKNEAANKVSNRKGTIAMARTQAVDSATAQFFINLADNTFLDHGTRDYGYAVFGKVVSGMETVEKIGSAETHSKSYHDDVPVKEIVITSVRRC